MLNSAETALSSVLEFTEKCIRFLNHFVLVITMTVYCVYCRISSYAINAVDNPDVEEFTDFLLDSFLKIWMPIIKVKYDLLVCVVCLVYFFLCILLNAKCNVYSL